MNTKIHFCFEAEGLSSTSFVLLNPPVLPQEGKIIAAEWGHFIKDKKALKALDDLHHSSCLIANILSITYEKDQVKMLVVLTEESIYNSNLRRKHI